MSQIGVFDSGLGGLSIHREILKMLPQYDYIYLGDNARVPYGGRSPELIYQYTLEAVKFLFREDCQLIILACNSATVSALRKIQQDFLPTHYPDRRVLGVVIPALETALETAITTRGHTIGVIATQTTVNSNVFAKELHKQNAQINVIQQACPLLVPIIEAGEVNWVGLDLILQKYLEPIKRQSVDSLILGCTHYGLIQAKIQKLMGSQVKIIDEGMATAHKLKDYLNRHKEVTTKLSRKTGRRYFVTDMNPNYQQQATYFMGQPVLLELAQL